MTIDTFTQAGIDFLFAMSGFAIGDWASAQGASFYVHGKDGVSIFLRGLKTGKCLAHQSLAAYGTNAYEIHTLRMAVLEEELRKGGLQCPAFTI